eukprot:symbB.v1.2.002219.t1/scaffold119.1/size318073/17
MAPKTRLQAKTRPRVAASEAESVEKTDKDKENKERGASKAKESDKEGVKPGTKGVAPGRRTKTKQKHKSKQKSKQKDRKHNKGKAGKPSKSVVQPGNRRKKKKAPHYSGYLYKVLKSVHPELGISKRGMNIMNSFMNDIFDRIATESTRLLRLMSRRTLSGREVQTSVRLLLPGELARHSVSEGTKAVNKFFNQEQTDAEAAPPPEKKARK